MMLKKQQTIFLLLLICSLTVPMSFADEETTESQKMQCPLEFGKWELIPNFSDEFDAPTLDNAKWFPGNPSWLGRQPGFFSKDNVELKDGMLQLSAKAETLPNLPKGYHTFTTAAVQSKNRIRYGYFEIRCRAMDSAASSAFWFYANDEKLWTEIDVFEIGGKAPDMDYNYFTNVHVFKTPETGNKHWDDSTIWKAPYRLAEEFHTYGFLWSKNELIWYVDGKEIRKRINTDWHQTLTMNFDSEIMSEWFGLPDPKDLPSIFSIDYVRSWKRIDGDETTVEAVKK